MNYRCVKFYGDAPACHLWVNQSLHGSLAITFALLCLAEQSIELQGPLAEMIRCKAWSSIHVHLHPLIPQHLLSFCTQLAVLCQSQLTFNMEHLQSLGGFWSLDSDFS